MFSHNSDGDDHGVRQADTVQILAQRWHIAASNEATNMLHRAMCLAPTQSTANEPGRLGDQSRRMGWILSRITNDVIEKTLVKLKL